MDCIQWLLIAARNVCSIATGDVYYIILEILMFKIQDGDNTALQRCFTYLHLI
jgi:hypothetical protein